MSNGRLLLLRCANIDGNFCVVDRLICGKQFKRKKCRHVEAKLNYNCDCFISGYLLLLN